MKKKIFFLTLLSVFLIQTTIAQKNEKVKRVVVKGFVTDINNQPIKDATITVPHSKYSKSTNRKGYFKIKIDPEVESVLAIAPNYRFMEQKYSGEKTLDFKFQFSADDVLSDDQQTSRNHQLIELGYNKDVVFENSGDAVIFNGRKVNPHKYASFEEMINKEMKSREYVVSKHGLYIVNGQEVQGVWRLKNIKPTEVQSIKIEHIGLASHLQGWRGIFGVCKVTTKSSETDS